MNAKLHLQIAFRDGKTYLKESYFTPPFKIANITENKTNGVPLQLMLMSSSPGILDEDDYAIKIELDENASLHLQTQSYQRLFHMKNGAKQRMEVHLQKNASFVYLPHPTVPHENASFVAKNKIYLTANCQLIWGEILTCGRVLNKEIFQFAKYQNLTEIFIDKQLVIKENLLLLPSLVNPLKMGQLECFTHQASLIILDEKIQLNEFIETVNGYLNQQNNIIFGLSIAPANALIIRILGRKAEQLHDCLKEIYRLTILRNEHPIA